MKQTFRRRDIFILLGVFCLAFAVVFGIQQISGRIDGVASMVFVLAVFLISMYTDGYVWGVAASLLGVLAVNFAFRSPYFAFNFTLPENLFSGVVMLIVSIMLTLTGLFGVDIWTIDLRDVVPALKDVTTSLSVKYIVAAAMIIIIGLTMVVVGVSSLIHPSSIPMEKRGNKNLDRGSYVMRYIPVL